MNSRARQGEHTGLTLNVFCTREREAWRVHAERSRLPPYLLHCFDKYGEAFPVYLDFEDLDRHMAESGVAFEKRVAKTGGVELTGQGEAARVLGEWLATAFASGVRGQPADTGRIAG